MVHTYSGILFGHKKVVLIHATTWMNIGNVILSRLNQTQRGKYCISLVLIRINKFIESTE